MKETILAVVSLAVGIVVGWYAGTREFWDERLPTTLALTVLDEKGIATQPGDGPRVVVEEGEVFDFGTMDQGSEGNHDFLIRNIGNAPLGLTMLETTCKCTAAATGGKKMEKGDTHQIPPGGSFKLNLTWQIKVNEPNFSQSAEFKTTDPRREIIRLLIQGKTVQAIEAEEPELRFTNVSANEPAVAEMNLYAYREQELKIVKHEWAATEFQDLFQASFLPLPQEEAVKHGCRGGLRLRVTLQPGLPLGRTRQAITLTSNYEGIEPLKIPVNIMVVGDLTLLGPKVIPNTTTVSLGPVEQKTGISHTIYLLIKGPHRESTSVQVARVEPDQWLKVSLGEPLTDSPKVKRIPIKIEIPPGAPLVNFLDDDGKTGRIYLKTTHPQIKLINISVPFLVRE